MAKCPVCGKKMQEVDYIEDLGELYQCNNCHREFYYDEDDGEWSIYEPLSEDEAEDIWLSYGMDEDYDFRP